MLIQSINHRVAVEVRHSPLEAQQRLAQRDTQLGVQVEAVIDGMPAAGLLKAGDLITQIDDQLVRRSSDLTGIVQSKLPGDLITVVLERTRVDQNGEFLLDVNGEIRRETVEVRFALGSIEQLSSDGGNVVRSSSVRSERARWVQQLLDRFASDPVRITIAESALKVDSFIGRGVEQHPAMIWLSGISIALERGTIEMDPNLRLQIFRRLSAIEAETAAESISPEERAWLELVAERYALVVEELNR